MPVVADVLGQVLDEVAAVGDVQQLRAAADREHGHVARERRLEQRQLGVVALAADAVVSGCGVAAVQLRVEVRAAREDEAVERVERLLDPVGRRRHEQRPAAGALDRAHVVGRDERRVGSQAPNCARTR